MKVTSMLIIIHLPLKWVILTIYWLEQMVVFMNLLMTQNHGSLLLIFPKLSFISLQLMMHIHFTIFLVVHKTIIHKEVQVEHLKLLVLQILIGLYFLVEMVINLLLSQVILTLFMLSLNREIFIVLTELMEKLHSLNHKMI